MEYIVKKIFTLLILVNLYFQVKTMMDKLWVVEGFLHRSHHSGPRTSVALHDLFNAPDALSRRINYKAEKLIKQTEIIQEINKLTAQMAGVMLRKVNAVSTTLLKKDCPWIPAPFCNPATRYRTINGSCNNLNHPNYGMARTPYQRLAHPKYAGGISATLNGGCVTSQPIFVPLVVISDGVKIWLL